MKVVIDISDWLDENYRMEEQAITQDDFVELATVKGLSTAQIARFHIVQRELGLVKDDDALPDNKTLLQNGGRASMYEAFKRRTIEIEVNGKIHRARELIGGVADNENYVPSENHDQGTTFESTASTEQELTATWHVLGTPGALEDALKYLDRVLPGQIVGRCLIIKASGGDVEEALAKLFDKIVKIAADFAEEPA